MRDINQQLPRSGVVQTIESTTFRGGDFGADAIFIGSGIITQAYLLGGAQLLLLSVEHGLYKYVAIFLATSCATHMCL